MQNKEDFEAFKFFIENGKSEYDYKFIEKPATERQNKLALIERALFRRLPRWAQDYFLRDVINNTLLERVSWLNKAVDTRCEFGLKESLQKKKDLIRFLNNQVDLLKKSSEDQKERRLTYATNRAINRSASQGLCYKCLIVGTLEHNIVHTYTIETKTYQYTQNEHRPVEKKYGDLFGNTWKETHYETERVTYTNYRTQKIYQKKLIAETYCSVCQPEKARPIRERKVKSSEERKVRS